MSLLWLSTSCDTYDTDVETKLHVIKATPGSYASIRTNSYFKNGEAFEISTPPKNGFTLINSGDDSEYLLFGQIQISQVTIRFRWQAKTRMVC